MSDFIKKLEELSQKYFGSSFRLLSAHTAQLIVMICKNVISDDEAQELIKYVDGR